MVPIIPQNGRAIASKIKEELKYIKHVRKNDAHIRRMIDHAAGLRQFTASAVCTIRIVGDSGIGKSNLINVLLDQKNLARTAGIGAVCTNVVTEYRRRQPEHTSNYTIEIDRMTNEEIGDQLKELLWSYRQFYLSDLDDKNATADDQKRLEQQSKVAWDTLQAAFGDKDILTEKLLKKSVGAEDRIREWLEEWTEELEWPDDRRLEKSCLPICGRSSKLFGNFGDSNRTFSADDGRVYLDAEVLKSGAILGDLPGLYDSNQARVNAAEKYVYECDEIFVVADIGRVTTNTNVEKILTTSLGKDLQISRPSQGISLVCTKSEDLDAEEIKTVFFKGSNSRKIDALEQDLENAEAEDDQPGAFKRHNKVQEELNWIFMTAQNNHIKTLAKRKLMTFFGDRLISVFCISNKAYNKIRNPGEQKLALAGCGIPELCNHCIQIPARAQFRLAEHFLVVRIPDLLHQVKMWYSGVSQTLLPNDEAALQSVIAKIEQDLSGKINEIEENLSRDQIAALKNVMIKTMGLALTEVNSWNALHHTQVAAFCRNNGSFSSPKVPYTEWNMELIAPMVEEMTPRWSTFLELCREHMDKFEHEVLSAMVALRFSGAPLFVKSLTTKIKALEFSLFQTETDFDSEIAYALSIDMASEIKPTRCSAIRHDACTNHSGSYIYQQLSPVYRDCVQDSGMTPLEGSGERKSLIFAGAGVTQRRFNRIKEAVGTAYDPVLFANLRSLLATNSNILLAKTAEDFSTSATEPVEELGRALKMMKSSKSGNGASGAVK
ncbi:uncharacterized protein PAC_10442 [Phialocephala subalpina]|uniref:G domain-containing protein n=1 Tax=Phialocephala subalpina TaxID=576137 RepID=A0A1L7X692_9HELO|nr:uncharacterized protein PAC_10442 [Phialocephala subalpina]